MLVQYSPLFSFQNNNFNKGGKGNDRVTVSVQDSAGTDNADFSTPAEYATITSLQMLNLTRVCSGQSGKMRMFLWDFTSPVSSDSCLGIPRTLKSSLHGPGS